MKHQPTTLICTVGTSLLIPNLVGLKPETQYQQEPLASDLLGQADKAALNGFDVWRHKEWLKSLLTKLKASYSEKRWGEVADCLLALPPELRLCGAEINSVEAMIRKGFLPDNRYRLVLLVSDTQEGTALGRLFSKYFTDGRCKVGFKDCNYRKVGGLQDEQPLTFQKEGLCNLVRILGEELRKWGRDSIGINATGGYKAQIALAVAFGQATQCPVFYKHERFDQIIRFPRVPFTIDLSLVDLNLKLWANLAEPGAIFTAEEMDRTLSSSHQIRESIEPMLEAVDISYWLNGAPRRCDYDRWEQTHPPLDWCIVGGETGPGARPMYKEWPGELRDQCGLANVPFFFKGWGSWRKDLDYRKDRLLDGREWNEYPEVDNATF